MAKETLPSGYTYEWSGQSREEQQSGSRAPIIFGLALVFTFLCLAALYESWSVPFAVLLRVPLMTSLAFIIGCIPLAVATAAGAGTRNQ